MSGFYPKNPALSQVLQSEVSANNPDRAFIAHYQIAAASAVVPDVDGVLAAHTDDGAEEVKTTGITNPAVPRCITATAGGTAGDIKAVQVIIVGTNILDEVITETLPVFTVDTAGTVTGNKAFKTVTSITIPAHDGTGATTSVGFGDKYGLPYERAHIAAIAAFLGNTLEATAPTITAHATNIENNTFDLNSASNGSIIDIYLVV